MSWESSTKWKIGQKNTWVNNIQNKETNPNISEIANEGIGMYIWHKYFWNGVGMASLP